MKLIYRNFKFNYENFIHHLDKASDGSPELIICGVLSSHSEIFALKGWFALRFNSLIESKITIEEIEKEIQESNAIGAVDEFNLLLYRLYEENIINVPDDEMTKKGISKKDFAIEKNYSANIGQIVGSISTFSALTSNDALAHVMTYACAPPVAIPSTVSACIDSNRHGHFTSAFTCDPGNPAYVLHRGSHAGSC